MRRFLGMKQTPPKGWEKGPVCNFCNNRPLFLRFSKFVVVDHVCSPLGSDICIWIMPHAYCTNLLSGHFVVFGFPYLRNLLVCRKFGPSLEAKANKWVGIIKKLLGFKTPDLFVIDFLLLHPEWTKESHSAVWGHEKNFVFQKICNPQNVSRFGRWLSVYNFFGQEKKNVGLFLKTAPKKLVLTRFAISKLYCFSYFDAMYVYSCQLSLCILGGSCFTNW